jgi:hypothetical protein
MVDSAAVTLEPVCTEALDEACGAGVGVALGATNGAEVPPPPPPPPPQAQSNAQNAKSHAGR